MYLNEIDPFRVQWLKNLFPYANVDSRDIKEILSARDERADGRWSAPRYQECHFFAGIGGWPYALDLAGWPQDRPIWTGSCPCKPFSRASHGRATAEDLWPIWKELIFINRPPTIFGEQVASAKTWAAQICDDLEDMGYAVGTAILPACSVGKDHVRERFFFVGHTDQHSQSRGPFYDKTPRLPRNCSKSTLLEDKNGLSPRVGQLRAYGDAIVPEVAAEFIKAFLDSEKATNE